MKRGITAFYKYARARHQVFLNRDAGQAKPWTKDPILQTYRFTNVFRELDKTTVWYRKNVRERFDGGDYILLATVVFRMFNRIEIGETIFNQLVMPSGRRVRGNTAFERFAADGDTDHLRHAMVAAFPKGPYVTGAYIISSPPGHSKLDGVLEVIRRFYHEQKEMKGLGAGVMDTMGWGGEEGATELLRANGDEIGLQMTYEWLSQFDYFGKFHSYEIVTDLRHTNLLNKAHDIMTWASPGPGARRGANRVMGRHYKDKSVNREGLIQEMREILHHSRNCDLWPQDAARVKWPVWEMRDVEHTLCEFDKYERVRNEQGRPRGVFR